MKLQSQILSGLCVILTLVIAWEIYPGQKDAITVSEKRPLSDDISTLLSDVTAVVRFPPLRQFSMIIERPLFDSKRRPAPVTTGHSAEVSLVFRQMVLTGVVITPEKNMAILQNRKQKQTIRLEPGESVQSWLLDEIHPDRVVFRNGAQVQELFLIEDEEKQKLPVNALVPRADGKPLIGKKMYIPPSG